MSASIYMAAMKRASSDDDSDDGSMDFDEIAAASKDVDEEAQLCRSSSSSLRLPDDSPDDNIQPNIRILSPGPNLGARKRASEKGSEELDAAVQPSTSAEDQEISSGILPSSAGRHTLNHHHGMPKVEVKDWEENHLKQMQGFEMISRHAGVLATGRVISNCNLSVANDEEQPRRPSCASRATSYCGERFKYDSTERHRAATTIHRHRGCTLCEPMEPTNESSSSMTTSSSAEYDTNNFPGAIAVKPNGSPQQDTVTTSSMESETMMVPPVVFVGANNEPPVAPESSTRDTSLLLVSAHLVASNNHSTDDDDDDGKDDDDECVDIEVASNQHNQRCRGLGTRELSTLSTRDEILQEILNESVDAAEVKPVKRWLCFKRTWLLCAVLGAVVAGFVVVIVTFLIR